MAADRTLSGRQREVAALIAAGLSNRAIAERLGLGRRTVDTHVRHILRKLGMRSRIQIGIWVALRDRPAGSASPQDGAAPHMLSQGTPRRVNTARSRGPRSS